MSYSTLLYDVYYYTSMKQDVKIQKNLYKTGLAHKLTG